MGHANKERMTAEGEKMKNERINLTQYWEEKLAEMPYLSRKYNVLHSISHILFVSQRGTARPSICSRPTRSHLRLAARRRRSRSRALLGSTQSQRRSPLKGTILSHILSLLSQVHRPQALCNSWLQLLGKKTKRPKTLILRCQENEMKCLKVILIHLRSLLTWLTH